MQAALHECRANKIDFAILHASPEGRPLYESLGFQAGNEMAHQVVTSISHFTSSENSDHS